MGFNLTPMVKNLLLINIGIFLIGALLHINLTGIFGLRYIFGPNFLPYQVVTNIFIHEPSSLGHLFGNMFSLFIFGPLLEQYIGPKKFLILYFVCGIGAGILFSSVNYFEISSIQAAAEQYMQYPTPDNFLSFVSKHAKSAYEHNLNFIDQFSRDPGNIHYINESKEFVSTVSELQMNQLLFGASGAVFGILMAFAMLFPNTELRFLLLPVAIKAKYLVAAYGLFEFYAMIKNRPDDNIAHFAHISGMIFAFILIKYWKSQRNSFY